jgi:hypothetical protein
MPAPKTAINPAQWIEKADALALLGVSERRLRDYAEARQINRNYRIDGRRRVPLYLRADVERIASQRNPTPVAPADGGPQIAPRITRDEPDDYLRALVNQMYPRVMVTPAPPPALPAAPPAPACPTAALDLKAAAAYKGLPAVVLVKLANRRRLPHWRADGRQKDGSGYYFLREHLDALMPEGEMIGAWQAVHKTKAASPPAHNKGAGR